MIKLTIVDGSTPVMDLEAAPDLYEGGDSGRFAPLVEFRVHQYELREGYATLQPVLRAAGEGIMTVGGRRGPVTEEARAAAQQAMAAGAAVSERLHLVRPDGTLVKGRVTLLTEALFGAQPLVAIGLALAPEYVQAAS